MFKIPKWGEDVPISNNDFGKTTKKKIKQNSYNEQTVKTTIRQSSNKNNKINNFPEANNSNENHIKKGKKPKRNKKENVQNSTHNIPGQFVMNPNKRKIGVTVDQDTQPSERKKFKRGDKPKEVIVETKHIRVNNNVNSQPGKQKNKKMRKKSNGVVNDTETVNMKTNSKTNDSHENVDKESHGSQNFVKVYSKKEKLKKIMDIHTNRNKIDVSGNSNNLRQRMLEKLKAAQFRYLNEKLYTSSGSEAKQLFQSDPDAFQTYHQGYQQQLKKWPVNPLDLIVKRILKMPKSHTIADMGCGEAALSKRVPHTVRSFDLVATAAGVEVCDMAHSPLLSESVDVAVYCLALMGTDLTQYLVEANRILKIGGHLLIAEVESRFDKVDTFTEDVQKLGFKMKNIDSSHQVFFFMEFTKIREPPVKKSKLPSITLKPCLYKRR